MHYWIIADDNGKLIAKSINSYFFFGDAEQNALDALAARAI
jgi:hypothetical protein